MNVANFLYWLVACCSCFWIMWKFCNFIQAFIGILLIDGNKTCQLYPCWKKGRSAQSISIIIKHLTIKIIFIVSSRSYTFFLLSILQHFLYWHKNKTVIAYFTIVSWHIHTSQMEESYYKKCHQFIRGKWTKIKVHND